MANIVDSLKRLFGQGPKQPMPETQAWNTPPPSLSHYVIQERIGSGGMGTVYRAIDRNTGGVVAVKVLHPHLSANSLYQERFQREANIAARLDSRFMVRVLDSGSDRGHEFIVSEYVAGPKLGDVLRNGKLEVVEALAIAAQVAQALEEASQSGVIHRDIKPDNIMFTQFGAVKVADFGISRLSEATTITITGMFIGTMAYTAPEQARGHADIRSDIYSLGITLFEMLKGVVPFYSETPTGMIRQHEEEPPPLDKLTGMPPPVLAIVARCLAKDPAQRYQHPSELRADIESARRIVAPPLPDTWIAAVNANLADTRVGMAATQITPPVPSTVVGSAGGGSNLPPGRGPAGGPFEPSPGRAFPVFAGVAVAAVLLAGIGIGGAFALSGGGSDSSSTPTPTATKRPSTSPGGSFTPTPTSSASVTPTPLGPTLTATPVGPTDSDGDGILYDDCPNDFGVAAYRGCPAPPPPDSDHDGVIDSGDDCPSIFGPADNRGCPKAPPPPPPPPPDRDSDGVPDASDGCPDTAGPVNNGGCPLPGDSDQDGVTDDRDACPGSALGVPVDTSGCGNSAVAGWWDVSTKLKSTNCPFAPAIGTVAQNRYGFFEVNYTSPEDSIYLTDGESFEFYQDSNRDGNYDYKADVVFNFTWPAFRIAGFPMTNAYGSGTADFEIHFTAHNAANPYWDEYYTYDSAGTPVGCYMEWVPR